jgi:hypothetical protein
MAKLDKRKCKPNAKVQANSNAKIRKPLSELQRRPRSFFISEDVHCACGYCSELQLTAAARARARTAAAAAAGELVLLLLLLLLKFG